MTKSYQFQPHGDDQPIVVSAFRTPIGRAYGTLSSLSAVDLLVPLVDQLLSDTGVPPDNVNDILVGNAAGGGGNVARLAGLASQLPVSVPGVTVDRQCGSGLEAIMLASRLVQAGAGDCYIAGGVESISTAPWRVEKPTTKGGLPRFYGRARFSPDKIGDPDMGVAAENVANECHVSRERQDAFALQSHQRAVKAQAEGVFTAEIVPVASPQGAVERDECPRPATSMEALRKLPPVFAENGSVTAGNSCPLNDGASLVLVVSRRLARRLGLNKGLLFIDGTASGVDPNILGLGPVASTRKLLQRQPEVAMSDIGGIEFNEAFASQVLGSLDRLGIASEAINRDGGAIALGHPFGASGAILVTRLFSQFVRAEREQTIPHPLLMAMLGIGGGLGLTALFEAAHSV